MVERKRLAILLGVMIATVVIVGGTTVAWLYRAAFEQQRVRLTETARTNARFVESVARHESARSDIDPDGPEAAVLEQVRDAQTRIAADGESGELSMARMEADRMVFLLDPERDHTPLRSLPLTSNLAEPMHRALLHQSGTMVALDSRGKMVLAAYEPVASLGWGVVAKVDMSAIRAPFIHASMLAGITALGTIMVGAMVFSRVTRPLIGSLRDSERQLRHAVVDAPFPIIIHAEDGQVVMTSNVLHEITGYRASEIKTMADWTEKAYGERREAMKADIDMLYAAKGRVPGGEHRVMTAQGEMRIWEFSAAPLGRASDGKRRVISMAMDVTRRDRAEMVSREASRRYQVLFNSGSDATFLLEASGDNPLGAFVAVNDAACHALGYERAELMQLRPEDIEAADARSQFPAHIQELKTKGRALWQSVHLAKDGRRIPVEISGNLFELSGMDVVLAVARDVSERERARQALAEAKEIAEAANRDKGRLLESLSHELRAPLTPVLLALSSLQEDPALSPRVHEELTMMRRQVETETRLIDSLIAMYRKSPADVAQGTEAVDRPEVGAAARAGESAGVSEGVSAGAGVSVSEGVSAGAGVSVSAGEAQGGSDVAPLISPAAQPDAGMAPAASRTSSGQTPLARSPQGSQSNDGGPLRILLVEDHAATLKVMARALSGMGHQVSSARTVQEAIGLGQTQSFDFLISDIGLPDGRGLDVMRWFGAHQPIQGIAISGYGTDSDIDQSREAGFAMHLVKPIAVTTLRAAIRATCAAHST